MAKVLARIVTDTEAARGPDATHRIQVPQDWLRKGAVIEVELPRNVTCAACGGGGCDTCERSGALSLRGRQAPPERVEVTLPARGSEEAGKPVVLRIPECGGPDPNDADLPRGRLLLKVVPADEADAKVRRLRPTAPAPLEQASGAPATLSSTPLVLALIMVVMLVIALLSGQF